MCEARDTLSLLELTSGEIESVAVTDDGGHPLKLERFTASGRGGTSILQDERAIYAIDLASLP